MIIIQDDDLIAGAVLAFKNIKFNCSQDTEGDTAGQARIELIETSVGTELTQAIFDTWKAEYNARPDDSYKFNRQTAYPSIQDQLDMQYHDAVNGTTTWKDAIQAVKDAHPKPSE